VLRVRTKCTKFNLPVIAAVFDRIGDRVQYGGE
jgi:hypothetical protein